MGRFKNLLSIISVCFVSHLAASGAFAGTIVIPAVDSGHYSPGGTHQPNNQNYNVGGSGISRNFFVFDLSGVSGEIIDATLRLSNPYNGVTNFDPSETVAFFDVTTDIPTLTTGGINLIAIYGDLGTGIEFGSRDYTVVDNNFPHGAVSEVPLNIAAVGSLNVASGGLWAIGGTLTTQPFLGEEHVFGFTPSDGIGTTRELVLNVVPEPSTLILFATTAVCLVGYGWRRKRKLAA